MNELLASLKQCPPRRLVELAAGVGILSGDAEVSGICDDSRRVEKGDAFFCLPRAADKAQAFIGQALEKGASCVLTVGNRAFDVASSHLVLPDMQAAGALLCRWFSTDDSHVRLFGVTGTDGKTSVAWMLREALQRQYGRAWSIGTLGWLKDDGELIDLGNTTPSLLTMHALYAAATQAGIAALVVEVSSHGIAQQRIAGLPFCDAAWTTLGHDHLQDHGGFEAYAAIKQSFVDAVKQAGGRVVGNADDAGVLARLPETARRFGRGLFRDDVDLAWEQELPGSLRLHRPGEADAEVCIEDIPMGEFHAANMACVALLLIKNGVAMQELPVLLGGIGAPPGRMQAMNIGRWQVFVDYAHTPEALTCALQAARQFTEERLMLVFGCGGERDREKRPQMGEIAAHLADVVWITSDNPRSELPEVIASEVESGMPHPYPAKVYLELDRAAAIAAAVAEMHAGDVLLIAGKGHEGYMEIGGKRLPWNDAEQVAEALHAKSDMTEFRACA